LIYRLPVFTAVFHKERTEFGQQHHQKKYGGDEEGDNTIFAETPSLIFFIHIVAHV
jgi:hypothetical protein